MRALTKAGLKTPAAVAVGVAVAVVFGIFALTTLPIQLFPDIERPQIGIGTNWRAATPRELKPKSLQPEEQVLQGVPGAQEMKLCQFRRRLYPAHFRARNRHEGALVDVIGRLNRLPPLPADSDVHL